MSTSIPPPKPEVFEKPTPLSDEELDALEKLSEDATCRPWMVEREPLELSELSKQQGRTEAHPSFKETSIHTAWHQGQLRGPYPVVTTASGPYYVPNRAITIKDEDADFIVGAANAFRRLLAEVRAHRKEKADGEKDK